MLDFEPATRALATLVRAVRDEQLSGPTPCGDATVADLIDHINGLSIAFAAAASKTPPPSDAQGPSWDGTRLGPHWRDQVQERLAVLARAWKDDTAWTGMTSAGGVEMPGDVAAAVALDEVVVHGWDLAAATGQPYDVEPRLLDAVRQFAQTTVAENPDGTPGLFGAPVPLNHAAPALEQLIALTGRDPSWRPTTRPAR